MVLCIAVGRGHADLAVRLANQVTGAFAGCAGGIVLGGVNAATCHRIADITDFTIAIALAEAIKGVAVGAGSTHPVAVCIGSEVFCWGAQWDAGIVYARFVTTAVLILSAFDAAKSVGQAIIARRFRVVLTVFVGLTVVVTTRVGIAIIGAGALEKKSSCYEREKVNPAHQRLLSNSWSL